MAASSTRATEGEQQEDGSQQEGGSGLGGPWGALGGQHDLLVLSQQDIDGSLLKLLHLGASGSASFFASGPREPGDLLQPHFLFAFDRI